MRERTPAQLLITQGPLLRAVLHLAWPVIVAEAMHTAFHVIDVAWLKGLGKEATAAVTISMFAIWLVYSLASMVTSGMTAHVAQAIGANEPARAARAAAQGLNLALLLSAFVVAVGWFGSAALFAAIKTPPQVMPLAVRYLRVISLGAPATFLYLGAASVMRATGDTRTPMLVVGASLAANVVLAPFLIYGWGPFPRWGVEGAALATILCEGGAVAAFAVLGWRGSPSLPLDRAGIGRCDWALMRDIARIGAPYFVMIASFSVVYLFFSRWAAMTGGATALAVVGVGNRLESMCYLPADGFAAASATIVGQNLGAGNAARASRGAWSAVGMMAALASVLMVVYLAAPRAMLTIFTEDESVLGLGTPYLRVLALCQIATGVESVLAGAYAGSGYTLPVLVAHVVFALVRAPLAWLFAIVWGLGLMGIAWTITVTCIVRATILTVWFQRGAWRERRVGPRAWVAA